VKNSAVTIFIISMLSLHAYGGAGGVHGGQGVVCRNSSKAIVSLEILDHYEGRTLGGKIDMGPANFTYQQKIKYVLDRLAKIDPLSAQRYQKRADEFFANAQPLTPAQMKVISDSNEPVNPDTGCAKEQFVVQQTPPKPDQARYLYNIELEQYAEKNNAQALAGIILHEVIYTDAVETFGQQNSDGTRYYNFEISSIRMNAITADQYLLLLHNSGFEKPGIGLFSIVYGQTPVGIGASPEGKTLWPGCLPGGAKTPSWCGHLALPTLITIANSQSILLDNQDTNKWNVIFEHSDGGYFGNKDGLDLALDSQNHVTFGFLDKNKETDLYIIGQNKIKAAKGSPIWLYPDGNVMSVYMAGASTVLSSPVGPLPFEGIDEPITFYPNNQVRSGYISESQIKIGKISYQASGHIMFDSTGIVTELGQTKPVRLVLNGSPVTLSAHAFFSDGSIYRAHFEEGTLLDTRGKKVKFTYNRINGPKANGGYCDEWKITLDQEGHFVSCGW
jgi:hypothetical protein